MACQILRIPTPLSIGRERAFSLTIPSPVQGATLSIISFKTVGGSNYSFRAAGQVARFCLQFLSPRALICPGSDSELFAYFKTDEDRKELLSQDLRKFGLQLRLVGETQAPPAVLADLVTFSAGCGLLKEGWMHVGSGFDTFVSVNALLPASGVKADAQGFVLTGEAADGDSVCIKVVPGIYRVYPLRESGMDEGARVVTLPKFANVTVRKSLCDMPAGLKDSAELRKYWHVMHGVSIPDGCNMTSVNVGFGRVNLGYPSCCLWSEPWIKLPILSLSQGPEVFSVVELLIKRWESSMHTVAESKVEHAIENRSKRLRVK